VSATTIVLWKPDRVPSSAGATHALDCSWVLGCQRAANDDLGYKRVPASSIPAGTPRCRHCGGGR